jgi:TrmH family RNA methyltransferase
MRGKVSPNVPDLLITSPANPRLKALIALRRRRVRDETGTTLVEGHEELALALASGVRPQTVLICPELYSPAGRAGTQDLGHQEDLVAHARQLGAEIVLTSRAAFERVAYREGPDGLLAVIPAVGRHLASLDIHGDDLLLVAQGVEKPGNLGAMLRSADAAGVSAVLAADPVTDWGNPNVIRASKGTVFAVPVAAATTAETLSWLAARHVRLVVTTPETDLLYTEADLTGAVAVAVGAEKHGADIELMEAAAYRVRIPMHGKANSLNVAASAAVVLFEARRQRRASTPLPRGGQEHP